MDYEYLARTYDEANIPLYLSYPVTSWWKTPVDEQRFAGEYAGTARPFLYFHFPYCRKACFYCACYKAVSSDPLKNDVYIDHLEKEFSRTLDLLGTSGFSDVGHLHWGGGTPTYLTLPQIERIFSATARRIDFSSDTASSISIEAYPDERDITVEKLKLLRDLGFNEISFGIQDFDPRIQWVINRDTRVETVRSVVEMSKEQGFRVHVDLCYGLPFQGQNELERTIDIVLSMAPDRVALFTYAHYPLIFPLQRRIPVSSVPNSFIRVLMTRCAEERFLGEGYRKVGYDHFVREGNALHRAAEEGKVVRDFMGYSVENRRQFIGFGHSAISFIGKGFFQNKRSEERRVGKECRRLCRSRWSPYH
jgi:oxygen-independent coproporphyrinogen-3 oxidase